MLKYLFPDDSREATLKHFFLVGSGRGDQSCCQMLFIDNFWTPISFCLRLELMNHYHVCHDAWRILLRQWGIVLH